MGRVEHIVTEMLRLQVRILALRRIGRGTMRVWFTRYVRKAPAMTLEHVLVFLLAAIASFLASCLYRTAKERDERSMELARVRYECRRHDANTNAECVVVGNVPTFQMGTDKEAACKVLEEAAELFSAWERAYKPGYDEFNVEQCKLDFEDELADVLQASCNIAHRYGIDDLPPAMMRCEDRNRARGRYGKLSDHTMRMPLAD